MVCRSGYRSGLLNCVRILYNFGVAKNVMNDLDSGRWILELACEWNTYPGIGSGRIKSKCKTPPVKG